MLSRWALRLRVPTKLLVRVTGATLAAPRTSLRAPAAQRWQGACTKAASPYELLGVDAAATPAQIKLAFFRKARRVHPDVNPSDDAPEEFRQLEAAYRELSSRHSEPHHDGSQQGSAEHDPRWRQYADPEAARARWRALFADREIILDALRGEAAEMEADLKESFLSPGGPSAKS